MDQAGPLDAARRAFQHVVLRQCEDDGGGAGDQIEKGRRRLAVSLGEQLIAEILARTAERDFPGVRVRQIDRARGRLANPHSIDLALELTREIVAPIRPRWRCRECGKPSERGEQSGLAKLSSWCHV